MMHCEGQILPFARHPLQVYSLWNDRVSTVGRNQKPFSEGLYYHLHSRVTPLEHKTLFLSFATNVIGLTCFACQNNHDLERNVKFYNGHFLFCVESSQKETKLMLQGLIFCPSFNKLNLFLNNMYILIIH